MRLTDQELLEQFERCERWQDVDQWAILALQYAERGYGLNALACLRRAEALEEEAVHVAAVTAVPA